MIQFHETGYGRAFFNKQLPDLIKGINRLADNLESKNDISLNNIPKDLNCTNCGQLLSSHIHSDNLGSYKVCGNCGNPSYVTEDLLDVHIYRLCGEDVICVLRDMGLGHIADDKEKFREMMNYIKGKLEIPWTEYLETVIDIKISTDKE